MSQSQSSARSAAYGVWLIASIFYAYQYILRVMPNVLLNDIMGQFQFTANAFGQFSGVYYIGYSLVHLPIGIMLDHFGPKKVITSCVLLTVIGLLPLLFAEGWAFPILGRFLIGVGSSAAVLGVFKIIRMTFSAKLFPRMLSFSVTIGLLGAIYGGGPMSYVHDVYGYRFVVESFVVMGILLAAVTYWLLPNLKTPPQTSVRSDIKEVLSNQKVIWTCLFAGMMVGPLEGFADVWATAFLKQVYGMEKTLAASLPSFIFIGMCVGAPILAFIAEKVRSYIGVIIASGIAMTVSFFVILSWRASPEFITLDFLLIGVCCSYQILAIYKASTYVREGVAGLTTAVANMIIMVFGYAFHTAIAGTISSMGGPTNAQALIYGIAVIPIALCIGTAGFISMYVRQKLRSA